MEIEKVDCAPLRHVIVAPTLRPDGSILQQRGYDEATATVYEPNADYPQVDSAPTREQCLRHIGALREVVQDFPFAAEQHLSAWLAGVLTCVGRHAITGPCPMFVVDANAGATGKTKLVHVATRLAYGSEVPCLSKSTDENEFRKQITSVLMDGDYAVLLDNVTGPFHSQSMAGMLTATTWSDRKVGSNVMVKVPSRAVWWATGNNMQLGADIARRSLVIRLDAKVENPEERFHHADLLTWVVRERARLVVAAVSILRGYIAADRPGHRPAWGTYDSWAALIPGAIRWLGLADPLTARPSAA
jgi:putative DNA primase/helicase